MIHSMAGGVLGSVDYNDFAKVKILEGNNAGDVFYYICSGLDLAVKDIVIVPVGSANTRTKAEVLRVDKNVSSWCSPVKVKQAKRVISIVSSAS